MRNYKKFDNFKLYNNMIHIYLKTIIKYSILGQPAMIIKTEFSKSLVQIFSKEKKNEPKMSVGQTEFQRKP